MEYKSVKGYSGLGQFGILLVFLGLGFILAGGAQLLIAFQLIPAGTGLQDMGDALIKALMLPENIGYARFAQVLGTFLLLFVPALLYSLVTNGRNPFWLGFNKYINSYQVLIGFMIIFAANLMASPLAELSRYVVSFLPSLDTLAQELETAYNDQVMALSNLKSWPEFIMAIAIMAFFPALFEEVFFRGTLQNLLVRWWKAPLAAILVTSLFFSFIHLSVYLFASRAILGFILGLLYHKTKNIWVNVIAHFLNNLIAVSQLFMMSNQKEKMDVSKLDPEMPWWIGVIALAILVFLFKLLDKYSARNLEKIDVKEKLIMAEENVYQPFANSEKNNCGA